MGIFPNFRGEHEKYLSCHHPDYVNNFWLCFYVQRCWLLPRPVLQSWRLIHRSGTLSPTFTCLHGFFWCYQAWHSMSYPVVSLNGGFSPQIIHFYRDFHYFHHPFWGTTILGNPHPSNNKKPKKLETDFGLFTCRLKIPIHSAISTRKRNEMDKNKKAGSLPLTILKSQFYQPKIWETTVDGRNPAPVDRVDMVNIPLFTGYTS